MNELMESSLLSIMSKQNNKLRVENQQLKKRIDKAIKYILEELDNKGGYVSGSDLNYDYIEPLLDILKGEDND